MYSVILKGNYEVENAEEFLKDIDEIAKKHEAYLAGKFMVYQLAPYVDYQVCDDSDTRSENSDI